MTPVRTAPPRPWWSVIGHSRSIPFVARNENVSEKEKDVANIQANQPTLTSCKAALARHTGTSIDKTINGRNYVAFGRPHRRLPRPELHAIAQYTVGCRARSDNKREFLGERDCTALHRYTYHGAVLPRRRPHHVSILSVCLSVCSVPCLHLERKRKGLRIPNLVGKVPGTRAPRGPISRSRGQRPRSRRLTALLVKLCYQYGMIIDYVARTYSTARTAP